METVSERIFKVPMLRIFDKKSKKGLKWLDGRLVFQTQLILSLLLTYCRLYKPHPLNVLFIKPISPVDDVKSLMISYDQLNDHHLVMTTLV